RLQLAQAAEHGEARGMIEERRDRAPEDDTPDRVTHQLVAVREPHPRGTGPHLLHRHAEPAAVRDVLDHLPAGPARELGQREALGNVAHVAAEYRERRVAATRVAARLRSVTSRKPPSLGHREEADEARKPTHGRLGLDLLSQVRLYACQVRG